MASCISSQFSGPTQNHEPMVGFPDEDTSPGSAGWSFVVDEQRETPSSRLQMLTLFGPVPTLFDSNTRGSRDLVTWGFTEHKDGKTTIINMHMKAAIAEIIRTREILIPKGGAKEESIRIARQELLKEVVSFYDHSKDS